MLHVHANYKHVCYIPLFCFTLADQLVLYYGFSHRSVKWWKRVFFHLLDVAIVNSHILFKSVTGSKLSQLEFRVAVAKGLMEGLERPRPHRSAGTQALPLRLTERPFQSLSRMASIQIVLSTEQHIDVTKQGTGVKSVTHPYAFTPALSVITLSKINPSYFTYICLCFEYA